MSKDDRTFQAFRLRFCNGESTRKALFDELQSYNDKLEKLLNSSDRDTRLMQQRTVATEGAAIEAAICSFWIQAKRLFKALASSWSDCKCDSHTASLLLQHRTTKKAEFQVFFTNFLLKTTCWETRRTRISEGDDWVASSSQQLRKTAILVDSLSIQIPAHRQTQPALRSALRTRTSSSTTTTTIEKAK